MRQHQALTLKALTTRTRTCRRRQSRLPPLPVGPTTLKKCWYVGCVCVFAKGSRSHTHVHLLLSLLSTLWQILKSVQLTKDSELEFTSQKKKVTTIATFSPTEYFYLFLGGQLVFMFPKPICQIRLGYGCQDVISELGAPDDVFYKVQHGFCGWVCVGVGVSLCLLANSGCWCLVSVAIEVCLWRVYR